MAFSQSVVVDVVKDICSRIPNIYFEHGEGVEVFNEITKKSEVNIETFPLIYLKQDFEEIQNSGSGNTDVLLTLFILTPTDPDLQASERMELVFKPILYPIYNQLINSINKSQLIVQKYGEIIPNHKKTDRLFWGTTASPANGYLDCIEINNLDLTIINNNC